MHTSVEHDPVSGRNPTGFCTSEPDPDWTGFWNNSTGSDMDNQNALITAAKCLIRVFWIETGLDQIFGQVYRIRIGPDYSKKILDWIRIPKNSDLFNTNAHPSRQGSWANPVFSNHFRLAARHRRQIQFAAPSGERIAIFFKVWWHFENSIYNGMFKNVLTRSTPEYRECHPGSEPLG